MSDAKSSEKPEVNCPTDKEYVEVIKSETEVDRKYIEEPGQAAKIMYYCRECKKPVSPKRIAKKLSFKCGECERSRVSFGTESSITKYYKIK